MNILVTGSDGFIGTNLIEKIKSDNLIIMCDKRYSLSMTNLTGQYLYSANQLYKNSFDFSKIRFNQPEPYEPIEKIDFVFHLGAISDTTYTNKQQITFWNYDFSVELFNWCAKNKIPLVYASSAATYGDGKNGFSDNLLPSELKPLNLYAETKNNFDEYVLNNKTDSLCVGLKFFNVYGIHEYLKNYSMTSLIHKGINEISKTSKIKLFEFGQQKRDFVFAEDVVDVMTWFLDKDYSVNGIYNVGTGEAKTFENLSDAIFSAMEKKPNVEYIPMPEILKGKYQDFTEADISKLRKIGYDKIFSSLEYGAKKTWDFYKDKKMDFDKIEEEKFKLHYG